MNTISAVSIDRACPWRATYVYLEGREVEHRTDVIVGWASVGLDLLPVRIDPTNGRGLLVGGPTDPQAEHLAAVHVAGDSWEDLPGMDEHVRALIRAEMESRHAEER
jgi:hypothetical protein